MVRSMKAVAAGMTALAISVAVRAAAQPIDLLGPSTLTAPPSDIAPSDTRSATALRLPGPPLPSSESPRALLGAARQALDAGRIGQAREALERAETALLNGSGAPATACQPPGHSACYSRYRRSPAPARRARSPGRHPGDRRRASRGDPSRPGRDPLPSSGSPATASTS
jgi:hypothetical protein